MPSCYQNVSRLNESFRLNDDKFTKKKKWNKTEAKIAAAADWSNYQQKFSFFFILIREDEKYFPHKKNEKLVCCVIYFKAKRLNLFHFHQLTYRVYTSNETVNGNAKKKNAWKAFKSFRWVPQFINVQRFWALKSLFIVLLCVLIKKKKTRT